MVIGPAAFGSRFREISAKPANNDPSCKRHSSTRSSTAVPVCVPGTCRQMVHHTQDSSTRSTDALIRVSKPIFSTAGRECVLYTPNDASIERSRRGLSKASTSVVWAPLVAMEKIVSEVHARVCYLACYTVRIGTYSYHNQYQVPGM